MTCAAAGAATDAVAVGALVGVAPLSGRRSRRRSGSRYDVLPTWLRGILASDTLLRHQPSSKLLWPSGSCKWRNKISETKKVEATTAKGGREREVRVENAAN